ncbi:MAG: sialidase family protein [Victivallaceae bacterium]|nr:sialidase family protein [Victivallaceae bacterium]
MKNTNISKKSQFRIYHPDGSSAEVPCSRHVMMPGGMFPCMAKCKSGDLISVLRGGAGHVGVAGYLACIKSSDGGESWTAPQIIVNSEYDDRNQTLGVLNDGTVLLGYSTYWDHVRYLDWYNKFWEWEFDLSTPHPPTDQSKFEIWHTRSTDEGKSWEPPKKFPVPQGFDSTGSTAGGRKIIQLADGTALMACGLRTSSKDHIIGRQTVLRSADAGKSWGDPTLIEVGLGCEEEFALLELAEGRLLAALRGSGIGSHCLWLSNSEDNGRSWSRPPRKVTDQWEHPGDLTLLSNGWIMLTFGCRLPPCGVRALISKDMGQTWDYTRNIVLVDNCQGIDCGYPTTIEVDDEFLATSYYRKVSRKPYFPGLENTCIAAVVKYRKQDFFNALS